MTPTAQNRSVYQWFGILAVAVSSLLAWYAWLGWDTQYQTDAVTGLQTGPYEAWQVIGCAASLAALLVCALLLGVRPFAASAALTLTFVAAWTIQSAASDETGLYAVGAAFLLVGLAAGCLLTTVVTMKLREHSRKTRGARVRRGGGS